jgi:glycosyltransferase involved in cell wall biosynthesis
MTMNPSLREMGSNPRPLRLAILGTQGIPARYGGYETFAEELAVRLVESDKFEVTVYCPAKDGGEAATSYRGVKLRYVKAPGRGGLANVLFDVWCIFACLRKHEIVYMCGYGASFMSFLPRLFGARVWINIGGLEWRRTKWPRLVRAYVKLSERLCGLAANRVICDARAILDYYAHEYRSLAQLSFVAYGVSPLPLGPDSASLLPTSLTPLGYDLIVARLEPENNVLEIIKGFVLHPGNRPLVVVGNLDPRPYVESLRQAANHRVVFLGGVYDKEKLAALRRYAFIAFHGHSVGGTNPSLLEAIAAGRPIVAHDNPFNREVGGPLLRFFAKPDDIPPVLGELEREAAKRDLDQLGLARAWLDEHYNWDKVASQYADLLRAEVARG